LQRIPPRLILRFFRWFCHPDLKKYIEGDLIELYEERFKASGKFKADLQLIVDVILLFRPGIIRSVQQQHLSPLSMYQSYFKIGWRNLLRNKVYSFINIGGLAAGMAVAMLIGLWIYDELSFEKYHKNYDRIGQVLEHSNIGDGLTTSYSLPMPLSAVLRNKYGNDFEHAAATFTREQDLVFEEKALTKTGCYTEPGLTSILSLQMVRGTPDALQNPDAILINESLAKSLFGDIDPINKVITLNDVYSLQVAGIYKDLPRNTRFYDLNFIAPIRILFQSGQSMDNWYSSSFQIYGLLNRGRNLEEVSSRIKNVSYEHTKDPTKPSLFVHPMNEWHLYEFKNGQRTAGRLQFVWLFGTIGIFVLILACINFMNLSTARSEKRSREVGIRKAIGSLRGQLIRQFFIESLVVVFVSLVGSLILVSLALPWFNEVSGKQMGIPWSDPFMWIVIFSFCVFTGVLAGSYPAIYLSSFNPVKVLKGTYKAGRFATTPRQMLVVVQFTVSITLIIGTMVVFSQIEFAKSRPTGYNGDGLITIPYNFDLQQYFGFRNELLTTNAVTELAASSSPTTGIWSSADNLDWKGKDPNRQEMFGTVLIDPDYGSVVEWEIKEGRNFSRQFPTDSACFLFNEAAIQQMGLTDPIGEIVKWHGKKWKIIGVVKDMVMRSPFDPVTPTVFLMDNKERSFNVINLKLNASVPVNEALRKIEIVLKKFAPNSPFNYKFSDEEYALKFAAEERVGKLAFVFATLAIVISCSGLFGLASFVAEQRTKEVGIRKILGASTVNLWTMLSKDFMILIIISCFVAMPTAYHFLDGWLQQYEYRIEMPWWIYVVTSLCGMLITLLTVSFQAIRAALLNPVTSLRSE
jgi:putative ABC transport system permease protein